MSESDDDDPASEVDAVVAAFGPRLEPPAVDRRDVVLVTGPWMAGVTGLVAALTERLPQHTFVETAELEPGEAPLAVVFVVSAAAQLTESDCVLLDTAVEHTDVVIGAVAKIDVHRNWGDVLNANRDILAAHAPRYAKVRWVGVAAAPDLGEPILDDAVDAISAALADPQFARRNRLRAWESRLRTVAQRFDRDADGAGRQARVAALREQRSEALRQRRQEKSERAVALRGQLQQAQVQLSHYARNRCSSLRGELQADAAQLSRRTMAGFEAQTRERAAVVVTEVNQGTVAQLDAVAEAVGMPLTLPALDTLPTVDVAPPLLRARRQETWLMMLLGAGFGLGVALTLSRLMAGATAKLNPVFAIAAGVACVVIGLAVTFVVVKLRSLLRDRALLDRWAGDVTTSLRSAVEELVATRVLTAETLLTTELNTRDEAAAAQVSEQVSAIDSELRAHAVAVARAAATRDREMPTVQAALDAVRAELGEPGIPHSENHAGEAAEAEE